MNRILFIRLLLRNWRISLPQQRAAGSIDCSPRDCCKIQGENKNLFVVTAQANETSSC